MGKTDGEWKESDTKRNKEKAKNKWKILLPHFHLTELIIFPWITVPKLV